MRRRAECQHTTGEVETLPDMQDINSRYKQQIPEINYFKLRQVVSISTAEGLFKENTKLHFQMEKHNYYKCFTSKTSFPVFV